MANLLKLEGGRLLEWSSRMISKSEEMLSVYGHSEAFRGIFF